MYFPYSFSFLSFRTEISTKCYHCSGEAKGHNNVEACSTDNSLKIEKCPLEDRFDECIVLQAFSSSLNSTIFKRECTSERFCSTGTPCSNPDYLDCRYQCCTGDLCNDFDFKSDEGLPQNAVPSVPTTTEKEAQKIMKAPTTIIRENETISTKPSAETTTQKPTTKSIRTTISVQTDEPLTTKQTVKESLQPRENLGNM